MGNPIENREVSGYCVEQGPAIALASIPGPTLEIRRIARFNPRAAALAVLLVGTALLVSCGSSKAVDATPTPNLQPSPTTIVRTVENTPTPLSTATSTPKSTETPPPPTLTPKPENTATAVSTATTTSTRVPEPTATPEGPKFAPYGVYKIKFENGEEGMFSTLPDGRLVGYSGAEKPNCGPRNTRLLKEYWVNTYSNQGFSFEIGPRGRPYNTKITGRVTGEGRVTGSASKASFETDGVQCPAVNLTWEGSFVDTGLNAFLAAYGKFLPAGYSKEQILANFEQWAQIKLPDSIEGK